jgi:AraC family transcriptional regulator, regulatory protein of adaptative response / DNA-3-methyladenine glycosylase II
MMKRSLSKVRIPYQPPFDFGGLMNSYKKHQVGNLEWFEEGVMHRVVVINGKVGQIAISNDANDSVLVVEIDFPDTSSIRTITTRVRNLFDLDSDPVIIANTLGIDPDLKKLLQKYPGIRLPSGWDPFEVSVGVILGQVVSIERGRTLVADLIEIAGKDSGIIVNGKHVKLFPTPVEVVEADLNRLKTTHSRKQALIELCKAIISNRISLEPTQDVDAFKEKLLAIKGIGPWTVNYIALKALRDADSLPSTDLILEKVLKVHSREALSKMSPWRSYIAALLWRNVGSGNVGVNAITSEEK